MIGEEEVEAVRRVIESKQLFRCRGGEGGQTDQFEAEWCAAFGVEHCITVTSGTAALICGLVGLGVGPGDEVIVPAYTWMATAMAALAVGAVPVLAEVDESLMLDAADVERKITPRTKAVIPVHMSGCPCDMDSVMGVARKHGLLVLEDACQAIGGSYKGKRLGTIGDAGAFSFNHFKIITCGEGGAVVTNTRETYERALIYHDVGAAFREFAGDMSVPIFAGLNFRMNEILSAVLRVQLRRLDGILAALRREQKALREALADCRGFTFKPVNDPAGDCGAILGLRFESPEEASAFVGNMEKEGFVAVRAIDSDRHVYINWTPILEQRGAHHPDLDPFKRPDYHGTFSRDMCPITLGHLERTVLLFMSVDRPGEKFDAFVAAIRRCAEKGGG